MRPPAPELIVLAGRETTAIGRGKHRVVPRPRISVRPRQSRSLDQANRPEVIREVVIDQVRVGQVEVAHVAPVLAPGVAANEQAILIVVADRHHRMPTQGLLVRGRIGTSPVRATSSDSKLSYTVKPKTNG